MDFQIHVFNLENQVSKLGPNLNFSFDGYLVSGCLLLLSIIVLQEFAFDGLFFMFALAIMQVPLEKIASIIFYPFHFSTNFPFDWWVMNHGPLDNQDQITFLECNLLDFAIEHGCRASYKYSFMSQRGVSILLLRASSFARWSWAFHFVVNLLCRLVQGC